MQGATRRRAIPTSRPQTRHPRSRPRIPPPSKTSPHPQSRPRNTAPSEPATIVAADAATYQGATEVVYRTDSGATGTVMVPAEPTSSSRRALRLLATPTDQLPFVSLPRGK